ncbi:MAG: lysophospholipase L1-like esterase [Cryomorphaceae bacterium]
MLLCGTNNFGVNQSDGGKVRCDLGAHCPPKDVAAGIRAIAQVFRRQLPQTIVIMMGILPVAQKTKWARCQLVNAINAALAYNGDEVVFMDVRDKFLLPDGTIDKLLFTDSTHLTPVGYKVWAKSIDPIISKMTKAPSLDPVKIMLVGGSITEGRS